jgi:PKD repeat protein
MRRLQLLTFVAPLMEKVDYMHRVRGKDSGRLSTLAALALVGLALSGCSDSRDVSSLAGPQSRTADFGVDLCFTTNAGGPYTGYEGAPVTFNGIGIGTLFLWDFGDKSAGFGPTQSHTYLDAGTYTVTLIVSDFTSSCTATTIATIANVAPTVGAITAPTAPVPVNTPITASASFTDPGTLDTHTAVFNWGDGTSSAGTVTEASGSGTATGTHTYSTAGVYTITLTVADEDGGIGLSVPFEFVVVYDPAAGFVTGGGWINSPAGAYVADPTLTGRATFGFVSRYQRGATVPSGNTEFQFQAGDLNFKSTSYDWLVIAGPQAKYKGSGTINGTGDFAFMLSAVDGAVNGGGGTDKFWIKIWDKVKGGVIYDNQMGGTEDAAATTVIGGGSIVIHS